MNAELSFIHTINQINHSITIFHKIQISHFIKLDLTKTHLINIKATILILQLKKINYILGVLPQQI